MFIGYNTNIGHKGKIYHVQTEDTGLGKNSIVTLLYHEGAILHSVKTGYADLVGTPDFEERVKELMKEQHKRVLKGLIAGTFDQQPQDESGEAPPPEEGKVVTSVPEKPQVAEAAAAEGSGKDKEEPAEAEQKRPKILRRKSLDDILLEHISSKVKNR